MHKINISIDDVSPHPKSSIKVIERCFEVLKEFPDAKFTLFVPVAYWRTVKPNIATKKALRIDEFPEFCDYLSNLPKENFEICYHGYFHGIPGRTDNDEFRELTYDQTIKKFEEINSMIDKTSLQGKFKKVFRPPAWRLSPEGIRAVRDMNYVLALSPKGYAQEIYKFDKLEQSDVVYYTAAPPFEDLQLLKNTEIVYHACEWDRNFLSKELHIN